MKRIIAILLLSVLLASSLTLVSNAATYKYLWSTGGMYEDWDITQETSYLTAQGYSSPEKCFDYEKGVSDKNFTSDKVDGVHLLKVAVWSGNVSKVFDIAETLAPNTYDKKFSELPIRERFEKGGFGGRDKDSLFSGYSSTEWYTIKDDTLSDQVYRGGISITRKGENSINDYYGHIEFNYNPCIRAGEWTLDYDGDMRDYHIDYVVLYDASYDIHFSISNVKFKDNKIYMDIEGEESYSYSIRTDMNDNFHHGMSYVPDEEKKLYDEEWEKYKTFKANTEKKVTVEETKRTFALKGVRGEFLLYDVEGSDNKNLLLKVEENGIKLMFLVNGILPHGTGTPGGTVVKVEDDASAETGEVSVSVPGAIVIGVVGGGAAVLAAAGSGASGDDAAADEDKKKKYKMYVGKDFGDAIRKGDPPVEVRARMVEVDEKGVEHDRDDLTALITVSGNGLVIDSATISGRYVAAKVHADPEDNDTKGSVIFTFTGEGGVFENSVVFRLVGDPYLQFIEDGSEAGTITYEGNTKSIRAIAGDEFTYKVRFTLVDATEEPKKLKADENEDFDVTFEPTDLKFTYNAVLKNKSQPMSVNDGFTNPRISEVHITAEMTNDYTGDGTIGVYLYPEGLSVTTDAELDESHSPKSAVAKAYEKEYVGDLDAKFTQIRFYYTLAVKTKTEAKFPSVKEAGLKFDQMVGEGEKNACIAEKYESGKDYNMVVADDGDGSFEPATMLWEPLEYTTGIQVHIPAKCEYEGQKYETNVYIRLRGKDQDPMAEWNVEHDKLIERIKKYVPNEYWHDYLEKVKRISEEPKKGVEDLRLMSKDIVRAYRDYWEEQGKNAQWWANTWDWMVYGAEWTKWIGDCAFSILCNIYGGPLADAILSPAKDVFAAFVGEVGVNIVWGTKFNIDNLECFAALRTAGDNIVGNWASDGVKGILESGSSWKAKAGMIAGALAAYLIYLSVSNYLKKLNEDPENASFWRAIVDGFKDLTKNFLKACIGNLMGKWLKSESFQKNIGSKVEAYIIKHFGKDGKLPDVFKDVEMDWLDEEGNVVFTKAIDVVETYLSNLCGEGAAKYVDNPSLGFKMNASGEITYTFTITWWDKAPFPVELNLTKVLTNTSCGIFMWLYDELCGDLPTATSIIDIPKEPKLPSELGDVGKVNAIGMA